MTSFQVEGLVTIWQVEGLVTSCQKAEGLVISCQLRDYSDWLAG